MRVAIRGIEEDGRIRLNFIAVDETTGKAVNVRTDKVAWAGFEGLTMSPGHNETEVLLTQAPNWPVVSTYSGSVSGVWRQPIPGAVEEPFAGSCEVNYTPNHFSVVNR